MILQLIYNDGKLECFESGNKLNTNSIKLYMYSNNTMMIILDLYFCYTDAKNLAREPEYNYYTVYFNGNKLENVSVKKHY